MRFGRRGQICDIPVVLEQFLDRKSVHKHGENVDKNKDQEVRSEMNGLFLQSLRDDGQLLRSFPGLGRG